MVRASIIFLAAGLAVACLASLSSATYYNNNLGWCLNGCRARGWWSFRSWQNSCLCRTNCIRSYLLRNQDPQNPTFTECIYRRFCAHYLCLGYYYRLKVCKLQCIRDSRKKPTTTEQPPAQTTPQPTSIIDIIEEVTATYMYEPTATYPGIEPAVTTPGVEPTPGIDIIEPIATTPPGVEDVTATPIVIVEVMTSPAIEVTATPLPITTPVSTATEATTTIEMTTSEMTTTEMTTTEATTTEGTTTEAMTTSDQPQAGIMS